MKKIMKLGAIALGALLLCAGSGFGWASWKAGEKLARNVDVHMVDFPVPFPLSDAELAELRSERLAADQVAEAADAREPAGDGAAEGAGALDPSAAVAGSEQGEPVADPLAGVDLEAVALERAVARGEHLVQARYACVECHGRDFGGGTMVDDPMIGQLFGPNLTEGRGSRTLGFTAADWDRIVRHGVVKEGLPAAMPAEDYQLMSDRELSDIIAYIRTFPPVDRAMARVSLGPLGTVLMATGKLPLAVDLVRDHHADHAESPPSPEPTADFGRHLLGTCTGCHRENFEGGPIAAGPPDWLPAANLTPHADGLEGWTYEQFVTALREMKRPDGSAIGMPMALMEPYAQRMTPTELQAMWEYLRSLEPVPTGQ